MLRFGIMINNYTLKRWQIETINCLLNSGLAQLCLVIVNANQEKIKPKLEFNNILYKLYEKFILNKQGALQLVELPEHIRQLPHVYCKTYKKGKYSEYFFDDDIETIRSYELDFILRFGFSIIRGDILNVARYGIWSYHHSDEQVIRGGPPSFWEVFLKHNQQGVILQRLTEHLDGGIILKKRFYKTILHDCSFQLNRVLLDSIDMPLQVCKDITNNVACYINSEAVNSKAKIYTYPSNLTMLKFFVRQLFRRVKRLLKELFVHEEWVIGLSNQRFESLLKNEKIKVDRLIKSKTNSCYLADPFLFKENNKYLILCENYKYLSGKAHISLIEMDDEGTLKDILRGDIHFSFPSLILWNNKKYLLVEQYQKKCLDLYELDTDLSIKQTYTLIENIALVDPVIYFDGSLWWLFANEAGDFSNEKLLLFYSESLFGKYQSHPQNPIKVTAEGSRMAGNIAKINSKIYRFGQNSARSYGQQIIVYEIIKMNIFEYVEKQISNIDANHIKKYNKGIHTLNFCNDLCIFDLKKYKFTFNGFVYRLSTKFKK